MLMDGADGLFGGPVGVREPGPTGVPSGVRDLVEARCNMQFVGPSDGFQKGLLQEG